MKKQILLDLAYFTIIVSSGSTLGYLITFYLLTLIF